MARRFRGPLLPGPDRGEPLERFRKDVLHPMFWEEWDRERQSELGLDGLVAQVARLRGELDEAKKQIEKRQDRARVDREQGCGPIRIE